MISLLSFEQEYDVYALELLWATIMCFQLCLQCTIWEITSNKYRYNIPILLYYYVPAIFSTTMTISIYYVMLCFYYYYNFNIKLLALQYSTLNY